MSFSHTSDFDHTERDKEQLKMLIKKLIINKEEPIYRSFWVKGDRETLNDLKIEYKDFILANKIYFFGNPPFNGYIQGFLNSVDKDWRTKGGRKRKSVRRTRKYKTKRY